jgi:hypothetical protein
LLRVIEWCDNLRAGWFRRPYGDQALWARRDIFHAVGGYPDVPLLEDVLLMRRLRRVTGYRLLHATVICDARRWREKGVVRTTATNWLIRTAAACGVPLATLARLYYGRSAVPPSTDARDTKRG